MSYNSKYTGQQVENLLDQVNNGTGGSTPDLSGYATKEELNGKVDKVEGKQLSTEDFTTLLKQKLEGLSNYDDTDIQEAVSKLRTDLDALVSGDTTTAIKTFNEIIAFLDGISDTEDLSGIIASIEQQIAAKQERLVSGTNIKTINGESVLGEGNIEIKGGGGAAYPRVNLTVDDTYYTLSPNTFYVWDAVGDPLEISLGDEIEGVMNEYVFQFTAGVGVVSLILPDTIRWVEDGIYAIVPGCTYRVSIINGFAKMTKAFPYEDDSVLPMSLIYVLEDTPPSENPKAALLYSELMRAKGDDGVVLLEEGMLYLIFVGVNEVDESNSITSVKWGTWQEDLRLETDRTVTGFLLARFGNALILGEDGTIYWLDVSAEQV